MEPGTFYELTRFRPRELPAGSSVRVGGSPAGTRRAERGLSCVFRPLFVRINDPAHGRLCCSVILRAGKWETSENRHYRHLTKQKTQISMC